MPQSETTTIIPSAPSPIDVGLVQKKLFSRLVEEQTKPQSYYETAKAFLSQPGALIVPERTVDNKVPTNGFISLTNPSKDGAVLGVNGQDLTFFALRFTSSKEQNKRLIPTAVTLSRNDDSSSFSFQQIEKIVEIGKDRYDKIKEILPSDTPLQVKNNINGVWSFYVAATADKKVSTVTIVRYTDSNTGSDSFLVFGKNLDEKKLTIANAPNILEALQRNSGEMIVKKTEELTGKKTVQTLTEKISPLTNISILGDKYRTPKKRMLQKDLGEDRFAYWLTEAWPTDQLGKISPVTLGILSQLRNRFNLTESDLPDIPDNKKNKKLTAWVGDKIAQAVTLNQKTIGLLESQLAASFIDQLTKISFEEIAPVYASYFQKIHGRQVWLKNFSNDPEKQAQLNKEFKKEVEASPLEFFQQFYGNNQDVLGIEIGRQAAKTYLSVLTDRKKETYGTFEKQRFFSSDFTPQLSEAIKYNSFFESFLKPVPKKEGKTAYEQGYSEFYDSQGKAKNKFASWIISEFDPMAVGILWSLRENFNLTEEVLPDPSQTIESRQKATALIGQLKPLVDRIEQSLTPNIPKSIIQNPNIRSFELGTYLGSLIKDIYQKDYLGREEEFGSEQDKRLEVFEQMMDGEYHGQRSEIANRCYRALYGISHFRKKLEEQDEQKLAKFSDKTEKILRKFNKVGFTATRLIQKVLSSPEGESMFKPIKNEPGRRLLGSAAAGVALAEGYRLWTGLTESSLNRPTQLVLLAGGFLAGRSNFLKDIRWSNVGKSALRGLTSYGLMYLTNAAIQKTGLIPDTHLLANIPLQATIAKQLASNTLSLLGLNFGSEWIVNELINQKHIPDRLTEYLYFRRVDPKHSEQIYLTEKNRLKQKSGKIIAKIGNAVKKDRGQQRLFNWTEVIEFTKGKKQTPLELFRAARAVKHAQEVLMTLMIHNPTRYRQRVVTLNGYRHVIDNQEMLTQLFEIEKQLLHTVVHQTEGDDRKKILSLLEETDAKPLEKRISTRLKKTRGSLFMATNAVNVGYLMALHAKDFIDLYGNQFPWLKKLAEQTQGSIDTVFGKAVQRPPQISLNTQTQPVSKEFIISEQTNYSSISSEVTQRAERLYTFLQVYSDQNTDPAIKSLLLEQYEITPDQVARLNSLLTQNNLTPEDLHIFFQLSNNSGVKDDFITTLAQKLSGSQHEDVGRLVDALTAYQNNLNPAISHSVQVQNMADNLYQFVNNQDQPLLERLGINSQSFNFQLDLVPGLTEQTKKTIFEAKDGFWFEGRNLIIKVSQDNFLMAQLPDHEGWAGSIDQANINFTLNELSHLYHSAPSDFNLALQNPHYSIFMGKVVDVFDNNWQNFDEKTFYSSLTTEKSGYFQELFTLTSTLLGQEKAQSVIEAAARGDPAAFNTLYNAINSQYPGQITNLFDDSFREKSQLENIITFIRTSGAPNEIVNKSKLVSAIQAYSKEFYLTYTGNTFQPSWPLVLESVPQPAQLDLAQLLNGSVPLEEGINSALKSYKIIFTSQGQVIGHMSNSLQVTRGDFPPELVAYVNNIEGPLRDDPNQFLFTLFGRNTRALAEKALEKVGINLWRNVDLSGASDPAMQLSKLLLSNMLPEGHQQQYSAEYLVKLILAVHNQSLPTEMNPLINPNASQLPLTILPDQTTPNIIQWAKMFNVENLTETPTGKSVVKLAESIQNIPNNTIKDLCNKLEEYLVAQRLIRLYGSAEIYRNYLNFVYLGNARGVPIYGMEAGAQFFFGKSVDQLNQGEQLLLVGLVQQPNGYSPLRDLTPAEVNQGFTSADQITRNVADGLVNRLIGKKLIDNQEALSLKNQIAAAHFVNQIPDSLNNKIPDQAQASLAKMLAQPTPPPNSPLGTVVEITQPLPQPIVSPLVSPQPATPEAVAHIQSTADNFFNPLQTSLEVSTSLEAIQTPKTIDEFAYVLTKILNDASGKHGQDLANAVTVGLKNYNIDPANYPELQSALSNLAGQTANGPLQCVVADNFFTALPFSGAEHVADLGGWTKMTDTGIKGLVAAREYIHDLFVSGQELISKENTMLIKFHSVDQFHVGDHFATDNLYQPDGHIGVVVKTGIDSDGKHYALIFDANYFNNGQARLVKVDDENVFQQLAHAPQRDTAPIGIIRLNEAYKDNVIIPTSIIDANDRSATVPLSIPNPDSAIKQVDIPVFEDLSQNPDGSFSVIRNPGLAMVIFNADGQRLAEFNPTGILGRVPILPGSTIKPFIYSFLVSKGVDPNAQITDIPGQFALDGHIMRQPMSNPYDLLNLYTYKNTLSLNQALAFSSNVPFEEEMWRLSKDNPTLWIEFQEYLRRFGLEMTDIYGNELREPTALAAIGSDAYIRSLDSLAGAYAILANPEKYFSVAKDSNLITILHQTRDVLMNNSLKSTPSNTGFAMTDMAQQLHSSTCDGVADSCAFKTGTVGGTFNGVTKTTEVLTVGLIKNGDQFTVAAAIEAGQQVQNGQKVEVNLENIIASSGTYGSMMILPWLRSFLEQIFKP